MGKSLLPFSQICFTLPQTQGEKIKQWPNWIHLKEGNLFKLVWVWSLSQFCLLFYVGVIRSPLQSHHISLTTNQGNSEIAFLAGRPVGFSCSLLLSLHTSGSWLRWEETRGLKDNLLKREVLVCCESPEKDEGWGGWEKKEKGAGSESPVGCGDQNHG